MKRVNILLVILIVLVTAVPPLAAKPKGVILATGGTIAGAQVAGQDAGYKSDAFKVEDLTKRLLSVSLKWTMPLFFSIQNREAVHLSPGVLADLPFHRKGQ